MGPESPDSWADICSAWFQGTWDPIFSEKGELIDWELDTVIVTLKIAGRLEERPSLFAYSVRWRAGGCTHLWLTRDQLDGGGVDQRFFRNCGGSNIVSRPLPDSDISFGSDRITVSLPVDGTLQDFADAYVEGAILGSPAAFVWVDAWWPGVPGEVTLEWDGTEAGRDFVIGQDKPPIPEKNDPQPGE